MRGSSFREAWVVWLLLTSSNFFDHIDIFGLDGPDIVVIRKICVTLDGVIQRGPHGSNEKRTEGHRGRRIEHVVERDGNSIGFRTKMEKSQGHTTSLRCIRLDIKTTLNIRIFQMNHICFGSILSICFQHVLLDLSSFTCQISCRAAAFRFGSSACSAACRF